MDVLDKYLNLLKAQDREIFKEASQRETPPADDLGLLIDDRVEKTAGITLPNDTQRWNKEIIKELYEQHDWLQPDQFYIRWKSDFDGEKGYALGVLVLEKEGTEISVPVIIKDYELENFDVFFSNDEEKVLPLTQKTVENEFHNPGIADEAVDPIKRNRSPINDIFPPRMGKYIYASMEVTEEDQKEFLERLKEDDIKAKANDNEAFVEISSDILAKDPVNADRYYEDKEKIASMLVDVDSKLGYRMRWLEDGSLKEKRASYYDALNFLKETFGLTKEAVDEKLRGVDEGNTIPIQKAEVNRETMPLDEVEPEEIKNTGWVVTQDKHGEKVEGYVLPRTYSLQTGRISNDSLLLNRDKEIVAFEPKIIGFPGQAKESIRNLQKRHVFQVPKRGATIAFMWYDKKFNDFVATQPAKIVEYEEIEGVGKLFDLMTTFGSYHKVLISNNITGVDFSANNKYNAIMIPSDSAMLLGGERIDLINDPNEFKQKMTKEAQSFKVKYFKNTNELEFDLEGKTKTAGPTETRLMFLEEGFDFDEIESILKEASKKDTKVYYKGNKVKKADMEAVVDDILKTARSIKEEYDLVKIAATLDSGEVVDKVLSLNFINKKNLARIFHYLPEFKEAATKLAELLLYSRIGNIGVPQESISQAMNSLQNLIEKLDGYEV